MRLDMLGSVLFQAGVGGPLWSAVLVVVGIVLFPTISLFLKTRAPGAKSFTQVCL